MASSNQHRAPFEDELREVIDSGDTDRLARYLQGDDLPPLEDHQTPAEFLLQALPQPFEKPRLAARFARVLGETLEMETARLEADRKGEPNRQLTPAQEALLYNGLLLAVELPPDAVLRDSLRKLGSLLLSADFQTPRRPDFNALLAATLTDHPGDLIRAALVRLMTQPGGLLEGKRYTSSYLWKLAYKTLIEEFRKLRRWAPGNPASETEATDSRAPSQELVKAFRECLSELEDSRRQAVNLHLRGFSASQVAKLLDGSEEEAEELISRGKAELKECVESKGFDLDG